MIGKLLLLALVSAGVGTGAPGTGAKSQDQLLEELLDLSGIKRSISQTPEAIKSGFQQQAKADDPDLQKIGALFDQAFRADSMYRVVLDYCKRHSDPEHVYAALGMVRMPLCLKMTAIEIENSSAAALREMPAYLQGLRAMPPGQARMGILLRMEAAK